MDILTILKKESIINDDDIKEYCEAGCSWDDIKSLTNKKNISENKLLKTISKSTGFEFFESIFEEEIDVELLKDISIHYLKQYTVFPFKRNNKIKIAINDPSNIEPLDDLSIVFKQEVLPVLVPKNEILSAINRAYGEVQDDTDAIIQTIEDDAQYSLDEIDESADILYDTSDAPVIKLVNSILTQAVKSGASDIHIEPYLKEVLVRYRIDGVLYQKLNLSKRLHSSIVSRIKVMSQLNIAEKRVPQDGRIEVKIGDREIDLRVSTIPTAFGERVVLRLLEKGGRLLTLDEIIKNTAMLSEIRRLIRISHGMILVTGPTGSGKTTTLYAALNEINTPDKNILTIEDPIEYQLNGIGQMQVNAKTGFTFANGLRAMVRQDPDVILVGEIRDRETAEIAIQAALTGHLVFSTLHTNDAASAITRLVDMGIEPFLVSSSVRAIFAQRLIRLLCSNCKQQYSPTSVDAEKFNLSLDYFKDKTIYRPKGCSECLQTGFKGRAAIFELVKMTDEIQSLILKTSDSNAVKKLAMAQGMVTLKEYGVENFVAYGLTSLEEVLRVTEV
jgi:general secretion pathway protein E